MVQTSISGNQMDRREFIGLAAATGLGLLTSRAFGRGPGAEGRPPNIVLLFADDLGYSDLGCHGGTEVPTPNIDSIAGNGVRFTNGYVSCPVCSPTRAGLLTGRYQQRFGHEFNTQNPQPGSPEFDLIGLPTDQVTIADRLKKEGYKTGLVGKWHLGLAEKFHPQRRGFDEFFGFLEGAHHYLEPSAANARPIFRGSEVVEEKEYLTDAFAREAVDYIERHKAEPFFLYTAFNAVHGPLQATQKYLDRFPNIADKNRRTYAAMLSALDDAVGRVLKKLRECGLEENTLIFFLSDNGGPTPVTTANNEPLRATKGTVYEGGIRVPFLAQWKGRWPGGIAYHQPVISLDILPTALAAAGGKLPMDRPLDGVDLAPFLTPGEGQTPHDRLYWRYGVQSAIREGNMKLVRIGEDPPELYDLSKDISESTDLAGESPADVKRLTGALKEWESQLVAPLWKGAGNPKWL